MEDAAARRRALRQKKILENSGKRLNRILGVPEDQVVDNSEVDGDQPQRRAPAFEGAPKYAYQNGEPNAPGGSQTNQLLEKLLSGLDDQQQQDGEGGAAPPPPQGFNVQGMIWLALGVMTQIILAGPHSWMIGENSMSVFSAAFCLHLLVSKVMGGDPLSRPRGAKGLLNVDTVLQLVLNLCGFKPQSINQILNLKNYFSSFVEKWSMFYLPFVVMSIVRFIINMLGLY